MVESQTENAEIFIDKYNDTIRIKQFLYTIKHLLWAADSTLKNIKINVEKLAESEG